MSTIPSPSYRDSISPEYAKALVDDICEVTSILRPSLLGAEMYVDFVRSKVPVSYFSTGAIKQYDLTVGGDPEELLASNRYLNLRGQTIFRPAIFFLASKASKEPVGKENSLAGVLDINEPGLISSINIRGLQKVNDSERAFNSLSLIPSYGNLVGRAIRRVRETHNFAIKYTDRDQEWQSFVSNSYADHLFDLINFRLNRAYREGTAHRTSTD